MSRNEIIEFNKLRIESYYFYLRWYDELDEKEKKIADYERAYIESLLDRCADGEIINRIYNHHERYEDICIEMGNSKAQLQRRINTDIVRAHTLMSTKGVQRKSAPFLLLKIGIKHANRLQIFLHPKYRVFRIFFNEKREFFPTFFAKNL